MIGRLNGQLVYCEAPAITIDVGGVGYDVLVPMTTIYQLPPLGEQILLYTHLSVGETAHQLFGFTAEKDRMLFRLLIKVSGIGPKMAIGIMSLDSEAIARCIADENVNTLVKIPGVGKRTAERLIVEMRGKLAEWQSVDSSASPVSFESMENAGGAGEEVIKNEAESALVNLGYKPADATKAVAGAYSDDVNSSEELIRLALKLMLPGC